MADLIPVVHSDKLLNPALLRFIGARPDSRPVVHASGGRWTVGIVSYDPNTDEVVIGLGEPMPPVGPEPGADDA